MERTCERTLGGQAGQLRLEWGILAMGKRETAVDVLVQD